MKALAKGCALTISVFTSAAAALALALAGYADGPGTRVRLIPNGITTAQTVAPDGTSASRGIGGSGPTWTATPMTEGTAEATAGGNAAGGNAAGGGTAGRAGAGESAGTGPAGDHLPILQTALPAEPPLWLLPVVRASQCPDVPSLNGYARWRAFAGGTVRRRPANAPAATAPAGRVPVGSSRASP